MYREMVHITIHQWTWLSSMEIDAKEREQSMRLPKYLNPLPAGRTRTVAPDASWMDLMVAPCRPIRLPACVAATKRRDETGPPPPAISPSVDSGSEPSITRLCTRRSPSIAGDIGASGSSLADTKTCQNAGPSYNNTSFFLTWAQEFLLSSLVFPSSSSPR
jgi:hypothetical protein